LLIADRDIEEVAAGLGAALEVVSLYRKRGLKSIASGGWESGGCGFLFMAENAYKHVKNLWNDAEVGSGD
jgi:hypothetical protein